MPSHKIHCYVDRMCFGRSFRRLHQAIDKPYVVMGRKHRVLLHDAWSSGETAKRVFPYDPLALEAAALHVQLDEMCSQ